MNIWVRTTYEGMHIFHCAKIWRKKIVPTYSYTPLGRVGLGFLERECIIYIIYTYISVNYVHVEDLFCWYHLVVFSWWMRAKVLCNCDTIAWLWWERLRKGQAKCFHYSEPENKSKILSRWAAMYLKKNQNVSHRSMPVHSDHIDRHISGIYWRKKLTQVPETTSEGKRRSTTALSFIRKMTVREK